MSTPSDEFLIRDETGFSRQNQRWNYVAHVIDGSLFIGAMSFMNSSTVLPGMLSSLGAPSWVIAFIPSLMMSGTLLPPLLTAHIVDRLSRFKPLTMLTGFFQRAAFLAAALVLFACAPESRLVPIVTLALTPFLSGLAGGFSMTAWQQLVAKTVPVRRRSSVMALRMLFGSLLGMAAGVCVTWTFRHVPGVHGYGLLCLFTFLLMGLSYAAYSCLREPPGRPAMTGDGGIEESLRGALDLLRDQPQFRLFLGIAFGICSIYVVSPFLAIHACSVLGKSAGYYGSLLVAQMIGSMLGNVAAAYIGDRHSPRHALFFSQSLFVLLCGWAVAAGTDMEFRLLFGLFGFAAAANQVGLMTLPLEICPAQRRAVSLALIGLVQLAGAVTASLVGAALWSGAGRIGIPALITGAGSVLVCAGLLVLKDPRSRHAAAEGRPPAPP